MERIIEEYYLEDNSKLVNSIEGTNGVDCWFDANNYRQHRCLTREDFKTINI